jgi:hypothetical protein
VSPDPGRPEQGDVGLGLDEGEGGEVLDLAGVEFGQSKDRRVDLKQVQAGLGGLRPNSVPVHARVFDGGAGGRPGGRRDKGSSATGRERRALMVAHSKP